MDKCILSNADVKSLFEWRDRNVDLVRRAACPIKGIEIVLPDVPARIKYVRDDTIVNIHCVLGEKESWNYKIEVTPRGWMVRKSPNKGIGANRELMIDYVGLYYALMALIAYGDDVEYTDQELDVIDRMTAVPREGSTKKPRAKRDNIIYLFNKEKSGRIGIKRKGERNSPRGQFNVRGHFRHLNNGKVIWIAEYKKGTGKKKSKIYKL